MVKSSPKGVLVLIFHPQVGNHLDFPVQNVPWKTMCRDTHSQHPAWVRAKPQKPWTTRLFGPNDRQRKDRKGPEPMIATLSFLAGRQSILISRGSNSSAASRLRSRMAIGFVDFTSTARIFALVGTNPPQHPGERMIFHNYFQGPLYTCLPLPSEHNLEHSVRQGMSYGRAHCLFSELQRLPGMAWAYFLYAAFLSDRPSSYSLGRSTGQTLIHSPQLVHFERSIKRGSWRIRAVKRPALPLRSKSSVFVRSSIFRCRPTSTSFGEIIHMAQSLVGKGLVEL